MSKTCTDADCAIDFIVLYQAFRNLSLKAFERMGRSESIVSSAVKTSINLKGKTLVVCSESGAPAQQVAKFRCGRNFYLYAFHFRISSYPISSSHPILRLYCCHDNITTCYQSILWCIERLWWWWKSFGLTIVMNGWLPSCKLYMFIVAECSNRIDLEEEDAAKEASWQSWQYKLQCL